MPLVVTLLAIALPALAWAGETEPAGGPLSLAAPLVAIVLAIATRKVVPALAFGAVVGAVLTAGGGALATATALVGHVRDAALDPDHVTITAFSLLVAATVGVMSVSGGTRALVGRVEGLAKGPRGAMVASWFAGMIVFFDDYANCLVVGSAMGPLYDRFRVSRAKLAYIVDSTAAPVASLALVSTWVGYEVGLIDDALGEGAGSGFQVFVASIPFRYYSWCTLAFVGAIAFTGRDFGPMVAAEQAARRATPPPEPPASTGPQASPWLAALPVLVLVLGTLGLLVQGGRASLGEAAATASLADVLGAADAYGSMLYGSLAGFVVAATLAVGTGALAPSRLLRASWTGVRPVLDALVVLYLAWVLSSVVQASGAGPYLAAALGDNVSAVGLPAATFLLAAAISFATGTSFGTMGILMPLAIPLAAGVDDGSGLVLANCAGAILAGSCFGDHASPISDTTVLSAIGSGVDVVTHTRTQLPYALTTGIIALVVGHVPAAMGVPPWLAVLGAMGAAVLAVRVLGRPTAPAAEPVASTATA